MRRSVLLFALTLFAQLALSASSATASDPRLERLINLRADRFPFDPPDSPEAWTERAERVRRQVQVAAGLWPAPPRPTPKATFHHRVEREGYTVEAVSIETLPGFTLTGSLYRPTTPNAGPRPGVLSPHGHWGGGRFHVWDEKDFEKQIALGAERPDEGGAYPLQARCVHLARMGCVVFLYDMLGYADSHRFSQIRVHAPSDETVAESPTGWGFYSTQAELRLQGPLGVQTYNSQCALDWLASLDEVDQERIAVTGGSSGATQTLMLCAVDDRPKVAFPVVMVSTAMQGGCGCENACCLRIGTSNVEFAALMAPKPLGMASADDWTRGFQEDGWPELQRLYATLGAPDQVTHASLIQFPHNYNRASRAAMYAWLHKHLDLAGDSAPEERAFQPLTSAEASAFGQVMMDGELDQSGEVELMRVIDEVSREQMRKLAPRDTQSLSHYRGVVGGALEVLLGGSTAALKSAELMLPENAVVDDNGAEAVVRNNEARVDLPAVVIRPKNATSIVVVASADGRLAVRDASGAPTELATSLLSQGCAVLGVDLFAQGDLAPEVAPLRETRVVPGQRPVPSLTYGYNRTPVAHRAGDLLAAIAAAKQLPGVERVGLLAVEGSAAFAAPAIAMAGDHLDATALDTAGFRYASLRSWRDVRFLPGAVKYGDLPGLIALASPRPMVLRGESPETLSTTSQAYSAVDRSGQLVLVDESARETGLMQGLVKLLSR